MLPLPCSCVTSASFFCFSTVWSPPYVVCSPAWLWPSQQPFVLLESSDCFCVDD